MPRTRGSSSYTLVAQIIGVAAVGLLIALFVHPNPGHPSAQQPVRPPLAVPIPVDLGAPQPVIQILSSGSAFDGLRSTDQLVPSAVKIGTSSPTPTNPEYWSLPDGTPELIKLAAYNANSDLVPLFCRLAPGTALDAVGREFSGGSGGEEGLRTVTAPAPGQPVSVESPQLYELFSLPPLIPCIAGPPQNVPSPTD
jgi:hypothetical protein